MTEYLLDTNVISELTRPKPDKGVSSFLKDLEHGYLSVLTIHELAYGLELTPKGSKRRNDLSEKIDALLDLFGDEILPVGYHECRIAALMRADAQTQGKTLHLVDLLIAATAINLRLTIVTRNEKDFENLDVKVLNPWTDS